MVDPTPPEADGTDTGAPQAISRRGLLGLASVGAAGLVVGAAGAAVVSSTRDDTDEGGDGSGDDVHPYFGDHQAGITTTVQDHLHFATFDIGADAGREELISLLQDWTFASSRLTQGLDVTEAGALDGDQEAPPDDTGEAIGLPPSHLTITIGLGPSLFERGPDGVDRFGIADRRPPELAPLPPFVGDALKAEWNHGDLCVQACADDPQVAVHAIRNLTRIAFGRAAIRWSQQGFGRTSKTTDSQATPRNLMGFKDGTANILADDQVALDEHVWVQQGDDPDWMAGGSYLVTRKIQMLIESWDRVRLSEQQAIFGRDKREGAPLSGGTEFTEPDFEAADTSGAPFIDAAAHIRLAHPTANDGRRLLRRGFNYVDGNNELGALDAGLFFIAFQRTPSTFIEVQRNLSTDVLNEYIRHIGSSIFAVPPGAAEGSYIGAALFE